MVQTILRSVARGVLLIIPGGGVPPGSSNLPNLDPILDKKKCNFSHPFSDQTSNIHSRFLTWPLGRNYVIITQIRAQTKNSSTPFRIRIFLFLSFLLIGIETINTFIHFRSFLENHTDSRPKWANCIPVFRPKRGKNPARWVGTYLYSLYKGVPPSPPPGRLQRRLPLTLMKNRFLASQVSLEIRDSVFRRILTRFLPFKSWRIHMI